MPGRITDELRRITREQGGSLADAASPGVGTSGANAPRRTGRYTTLLTVVAIAVIVGLGFWLVRTLQRDSKLQDCVMSGRKNCVAPDDTSP